MERDLIDESIRAIEPHGDRVAAYFYARLFMESPDLRDMFPPAMDIQRDRLFSAIVRIVRGGERPELLEGFLGGLGRDHRKFGVKAAHYEAVGRALIAAVSRYAAEAWTSEVEAAWTSSYTNAATAMIDASRRAALDTPDWWLAEIVAREERTDEIVVLQVKPDHYFPFEAGQYASMETPWWPRVWRNYSMANAPRKDNLLEFQIRKIDAGWVSTSLVRRAAVGDVIRLGHATGTMTVDRTSERDVLCLAGGTGLAPIRSIIEDMAKWNWYRRVHLFVGVRRADDFYDTPALRALADAHEWLNVIRVVSDDPGYPGERGTAVEAALRLGRWRDHDVFISGSAPMIRGSMDRLLMAGVPLSRIRFDDFGDPNDHNGYRVTPAWDQAI